MPVLNASRSRLAAEQPGIEAAACGTGLDDPGPGSALRRRGATTGIEFFDQMTVQTGNVPTRLSQLDLGFGNLRLRDAD
jgi:hypothetical protein